MTRKYKKRGCYSSELTEREQEVYNLIVNEGLGITAVSKRLHLSKGTVGKYFSNIYGCYSVSSVTELIVMHYKKLISEQYKI